MIPQSPIDVFVSYAPEDTPHLKQLELHLSLMQRDGLIRTWHAGRVTAGDETKAEISRYLQQARVILLLVSANYMANDECWVQMQWSMKCHFTGRAKVIPVIAEACEWNEAPFGSIEPLPADRLPVAGHPNISESWRDVATGIRGALTKLPSVFKANRAIQTEVIAQTATRSLHEATKTRTKFKAQKKIGWPIVVSAPMIRDLFNIIQTCGDADIDVRGGGVECIGADVGVALEFICDHQERIESICLSNGILSSERVVVDLRNNILGSGFEVVSASNQDTLAIALHIETILRRNRAPYHWLLRVFPWETLFVAPFLLSVALTLASKSSSYAPYVGLALLCVLGALVVGVIVVRVIGRRRWARTKFQIRTG